MRPATPDDVVAVHELGLATHSSRSTPALRPDDVDRYRDDVDDLLVAEVDGRVVGMALLGRATSLPSNRHVLMLQGLDVHLDVQGRGLGRRLLRAAMVEAHRRGAKRITLRVLAPNEVARRLYEAAGFVVEGPAWRVRTGRPAGRRRADGALTGGRGAVRRRRAAGLVASPFPRPSVVPEAP